MNMFGVRERGKTTYREIPDLLQRKRSFKGNSMWARWEKRTDSIVGCPLNTYVVYSYSTAIATWDSVNKSRISNESYSPTTSRHQNLCRTWL